MKAYQRIGIAVALLVAVIAVFAAKASRRTPIAAPPGAGQPAVAAVALPRLLDLGSRTCIPCVKMAPILEQLRNEYVGRLKVDFIDVAEDPNAGEKYRIRLIPTQIFFDATGKELFRHEGFISRDDILARWAALGLPLRQPVNMVSRDTPLKPLMRPAQSICFMCDGDIEAKTLVTVKTSAAERRFCSPHCFFIYLSSLPKPEGIEDAAMVTDSATGSSVAAKIASYRYRQVANGRPVVEVLAAKDAADTLSWDALKGKEFAIRCAFCDRVTYAEDSSRVTAGGVHLHACCPVCGLGAAARLQQDIELDVRDALTGHALRVGTLDGNVASLEPPTMIAWHGQTRNAEGKMTSAGCFKQYFFASPENLHKWLETHPEATGRMATIGELLADKMKLSPQQIKNACKIGDCAQ